MQTARAIFDLISTQVLSFSISLALYGCCAHSEALIGYESGKYVEIEGRIRLQKFGKKARYIQLDKLIAEHERQQKAFEDEIERITIEAQNQISEVERNYADGLEKERVKYQKDYMESIKKLEEQLVMNQKKHGSEKITNGPEDDSSNVTTIKESCRVHVEEIDDLTKLLQKEMLLRKAAEEEVQNLKIQLTQWKRSEAAGNSEILKLRKMLEDEEHQKEKLEGEIATLHSQLLQLSFEANETSQRLDRNESGKVGALESLMTQVRHPLPKDSGNEEKTSIAKLFEQVGLQKILSLLEAEDNDVRIHAVKVVANLAAEAQQNVVIPLKKVGQKVNLEVDILSKYVERLLSSGFVESSKSS